MKTTRRIVLILSAICLLLLSSITPTLRAQSGDTGDENFSMSISLTSDQFFGFAPMAAGTYKVGKTIDFSFYGIFWSGGTGGGWGNWTEFGAGLNFRPNDVLAINPQIGIVNGSLLSKGVGDSIGVFGEGLVPNLTVNLQTATLEGQIYAGYYFPIRDLAPADGTTLSYLHYWTNFGVKLGKFFSFGAHYEHLINTGGSNVEKSEDVYQWLGPYVQFTEKTGKVYLRFAGGTDFTEGNDSFFKMTVGYNF
ncbi:MAG: DUF6733 family protein [Chloroherpetonaceae bacterium]